MRNNSEDVKRYLIQLWGIVQGVGFRPYIYQKAKEYHIYGWVNNTGASVVIDAEGTKEVLKYFILDIIKKPPILAVIEKNQIQVQKYIGYTYFEIKHSNKAFSKIKWVSPDMAVCDKCIEEINDPSSRRYRYAFTNCTECGPRYSIIASLPYDRCNTTMKDFVMCDQCNREYQNPESRRFHTQPNCCNYCGPTFTLINRKGEPIESFDVIRKTVEFIKEGSIIAIKGIGGFHLCCDGKKEAAIAKLRIHKKRPDKPLAVMARDIKVVQKYCELSEKEQVLLTNQSRPIVLLKKNISYDLPKNIAPYQKRLGVMLPYLPIHYLLFEDEIELLVMTSGNISGMPIQYKNKEAIEHLSGIADYFLLHNRNIYNPIDDSVTKIVANREVVSRGARGYIPYVQNIGVKYEILALGAEQKSTFCISQNGYVYMSQYLGDLKNMDCYSLYKRTIHHLTQLFQSSAQIYAHDLHPQYFSTQYAQRQEGEKIAIQHHHAHMVSCMVEHKLHEEAIGVIFDGTGLGTDGSIWGGEFFVGSRRSFQRIGHLKSVLLQGGDTVVKEPWKTAVSYLSSLGYDAKKYLNTISAEHIEIVQQALASNFNCHVSSSMGRFFDCIAALASVRQYATYDAQAAIELESILDSSITTCYSYSIEDNDGIFELDYGGIIGGVLADIEQNVPPSVISAIFHNTISDAVVNIICTIRNIHGLEDVVLSGGVFENTYLLESVYRALQGKGFRVFFNEQIPINDGGICVGQLAIADELMKEGSNVPCNTGKD